MPFSSEDKQTIKYCTKKDVRVLDNSVLNFQCDRRRYRYRSCVSRVCDFCMMYTVQRWGQKHTSPLFRESFAKNYTVLLRFEDAMLKSVRRCCFLRGQCTHL